MAATRRTVVGVLMLVSALLAGPAFAQQQQEPADLWADFNHYVLIARPELAAGAGQALLDQVDNATLLEVVESGDYDNWQQNLRRAARMGEQGTMAGQGDLGEQGESPLREVALTLERRIQEARIERARDVERIRQDIELLARGQRPYRNAVERLAAAGQYAAPELLATLRDQEQSRLHPYVVQAMVDIGRPLVYPLSVALPQLEPVTMTQVAQVLAQIGYPDPMPYMKEILEGEVADASARPVVQRAYDTLREASGLSGDPSAAELYLMLSRSQYRSATRGEPLPGFDDATGKGIVWEYTPVTGLVPVEVPGAVYGDVRAMRTSRRSLELNPSLDAALSQWLMANLRRENRLPAGEMDPSYGLEMQPPLFYAMLAGPLRLHDVLAQALSDRDAALALDAIAALADTAGTEALVNIGAARQPLLQALSYPDRRVRFEAAVALANAKPNEPFEGSFRVVPVLAEAVRQSDVRYALVLADEQEPRNRLLAALNDLGFETFGAATLVEATEELAYRPGVDLIVVAKSVADVERVFQESATNHKLAATPILAIADPAEQFALQQRLGQEPRVTLTTPLLDEDPQQFRSAVEQAAQSYAGEPIEPAEAEEIALTALRVLRDIALASEVYQVGDALPALTRALEDERPIIVVNAGKVLALINDPDAQRSLAQSALEAPPDVQVALLESLAESATYFGNMLEPEHSDALLELVRTSVGDTAIAAAEAHGALALPTSNAVDLIINPPQP